MTTYIKKITHIDIIRILVALALSSISLMVESATTFSIIHHFTNNPASGLNLKIPDGFLAQGRDGNLYGTAESDFFPGNGGAFKISPTGIYTRLHNFNPLIEGRIPQSGFSLGKDGNFYGTTAQSRSGVFGLAGVIFRMTPAGKLTVLKDFKITSPCNLNDAELSYSPPVQGRDGNWYGTTSTGGNCNVNGTVYRLTVTNSFSVIHHFNITDGSSPVAPLTLGLDGNFYGTTKSGGSNGGFGTVFRATPTGTLKVLHSFNLANKDTTVQSPVIQGIDGNFYGTTSGRNGFPGSIFRVSPSGVFKNLHTFDNVKAFANGFTPDAGLVQASDGNFYGTTSYGGLNNAFSSGCGVVFKITPAGVYSVLHRFNNATEGCVSNSTSFGQSMTLHTNGKIYGSTKFGGSGVTGGTIFQLDIGARPFVSPIPSAAKAGIVIDLLGDITGVTGVKFNGINAPSFTKVSNSYLRVKVPAGATNGTIVVLKGKTSLSSLKPFIVSPGI